VGVGEVQSITPNKKKLKQSPKSCKRIGKSLGARKKNYTPRELKEAVQAVISGQITPAALLKESNIPRRTFFAVAKPDKQICIGCKPFDITIREDMKLFKIRFIIQYLEINN
jgi:hypothetical protein